MKRYESGLFFAERAFPLTAELSVQRQNMVPHYHDFIEIVLISRGSSIHEVTFDGERQETYGVIRGDLFAIMPGEVHSYHASRQFELYNIAFLPEVIAAERAELLELDGCRMLLAREEAAGPQRIYLGPEQRQRAIDCLQRMIRHRQMRSPGYRLCIKTAFLDFLLTVGTGVRQNWEQSDIVIKSRFLDVLDQLEQDPVRDVSLKKLAKAANMSISAYTKQFRSVIGLSPVDYAIHLRLLLVRRLLLNTDLTLNEIAVQAGFCDSNYMIKLFRERHGIPPGKLRNTLKLGK